VVSHLRIVVLLEGKDSPQYLSFILVGSRGSGRKEDKSKAYDEEKAVHVAKNSVQVAKLQI
jgi:hypothetical protein